jgi:hypothetical protein
VLAHQVERRAAEILSVPTIARPAALLRSKASNAIAIVGLQQPVNLRAAQSQQLGRLDDAKPTFTDLLDSFKAMKFVLRQGDETRHDGPQVARSIARLRPKAFLSSFDSTRAGDVKVGDCRISNLLNCRISIAATEKSRIR